MKVREKGKSRRIKGICLWGLILIWAAFLLWLKKPATIRNFTVPRQSSEKSENNCALLVYGKRQAIQTFKAEDSWNAIEVLIRTGNANVDGYYYIKLYDEQGTCIKTWKKDKHSINGDWVVFGMGKTYPPSDQIYTIKVMAPGLSNYDPIIIYMNSEPDGKIARAEFNGRKSGTLLFSVVKVYHNYFAITCLLVFFLTFFLTFIVQRKNNILRAAEFVFGMGLCWLIIMAPFSEPDSQYHYESALTLSSALLGKQDLGKVEKEYVDYSDLMVHQNPNSAYVRVLKDIIPDHEIDRTETYLYTENNALTTPLLYLPQAIGVSLGRILALNFTYTYYLGSLFSLLGYVLMVTCAYWVMPVKKDLVLLAAVMPMCLHQAVSYSYDTVINGFSIILVTYIIRMIYLEDRVINYRNMVLIGLLAGITAAGKVVYVVGILLLLAVPFRRYRGKKDYFLKNCTALFTSGLVLFFSNFITVLGLLNGTFFNSGVRRYTLSFIYRKPAYFIQLLSNSLFDEFWGHIQQLFGRQVAGLNITMPEVLTEGFILFTLLVTFDASIKWSLTGKQRFVFFLTGVLEIILVYVGMMIGWTQYGALRIDGVQGRYMIPIVLPILLGIRDHRIQVRMSGKTYAAFYAVLELTELILVMNYLYLPVW